jgi:hypothetical protein
MSTNGLPALRVVVVIATFGKHSSEDPNHHEENRQQVEDPEIVADVGEGQGHPLETDSR